jgi:hypothetical protein
MRGQTLAGGLSQGAGEGFGDKIAEHDGRVDILFEGKSVSLGD